MKKTNKRITAATMSLLLVLTVMLSLCTVNVSAATPAINTSNRMFVACFATRIRSGASTSYSSLESLSKNAYRYSQSTTSGTYDYSTQDWMRLNTSGGTNGYIRRDMVCPTDRCYKITASSGLNLRERPEADSRIIATIPYGEYVQVKSITGGYSVVIVRTGDYEEEEGCVVNTYLARVCSVEQGV